MSLSCRTQCHDSLIDFEGLAFITCFALYLLLSMRGVEPRQEIMESVSSFSHDLGNDYPGCNIYCIEQICELTISDPCLLLLVRLSTLSDSLQLH